MSKELAKVRRKNSCSKNLLENTFATKHLTNLGLISDLSELKLPNLAKSPIKKVIVKYKVYKYIYFMIVIFL